MSMSSRAGLVALGLALAGCAGEDDAEPGFSFVAATFNTGTTAGMGHDAPPDDGYGSAQAKLSDTHYGDGLAWQAVVDDTRVWFDDSTIDVVGFQEIFHSDECATIPTEAQPGFVCESWKAGDPTVAQLILGPNWQIACHQGHADKCLAVKKSFGSIQGCSADVCLDGLPGGEITGCGKGSRIGRAVIELAKGGTLTVVNVHGSSGIAQDDQDCRVKQFEQVLVDLGDGAPAANGERNVILGDFNTDPGRMADFDESAALVNAHAGPGRAFHFVTEVGAEATPTYSLFNIDHVLSDAFGGSCWVAGQSEGHAPVSGIVYFDHKPHVCKLAER